jgi:hypothetical protein
MSWRWVLVTFAERSAPMLSELQRRIVLAVLGDAKLDAIEAMIVDPAPIDEEHRSALWLYAEALLARRRDGRDAILSERELVGLVS